MLLFLLICIVGLIIFVCGAYISSYLLSKVIDGFEEWLLATIIVGAIWGVAFVVAISHTPPAQKIMRENNEKCVEKDTYIMEILTGRKTYKIKKDYD